MKFQDETRFEFRQFGKDLSAVKQAFAALGPGKEHPARSETYIVTRLNIEANVKIRAGRLEVKGLRGRLQMLEQWTRVLNSEFPIPVEEVENVVIPALGLDLELGRGGALTERALLALVSGQPALAVVEVDKKRTLFDLGDCEAEFCELQIGDDRMHTISVEATDADVARAVLRKAGLEDVQNESYAAFLQKRLFENAIRRAP